MRQDAWDPDQYHRFAAERSQPFFDLLDLVQPGPDGIRRAADLGCGFGELTALAAERFVVAEMVGVDSSPAMLAQAAAHARPGLTFAAGDIGHWSSDGDHDLVLANASLQWVPDHPAVLARWVAALRPGGQLAVQVPANHDAPSHTVAWEVATSPEFAEAFGPTGPPPDPVAANVLRPEEYATVLHELGLDRPHVRLQVYSHVLPSSRDVVEWVKGTTLTRFQRILPADAYAEFLARYEARLLEVIGHHQPYLFPFKRILMWGRVRAA